MFGEEALALTMKLNFNGVSVRNMRYYNFFQPNEMTTDPIESKHDCNVAKANVS